MVKKLKNGTSGTIPYPHPPSFLLQMTLILGCILPFWFFWGFCFFFSLVQHFGVTAAPLRDILFLILNSVSEYCGLFLHTV